MGDYMSDDLNKIFREKSKSILENKMILDIDNNTDSLNLTIFNVIMLEMNKLHRSVVKLCEEKNIDYNDVELRKLINDEKVSLNDLVVSQFGSRRYLLEDHIKKHQDGLDSDEMKEINDNMVTNINVDIGRRFATSFFPEIKSKLKLSDEEDLVRLNGLVRLASATIQDRIKRNTNTRFINLMNVLQESCDKSTKFVDMTVDTISKNDLNRDAKEDKGSVSKKKKSTKSSNFSVHFNGAERQKKAA